MAMNGRVHIDRDHLNLNRRPSPTPSPTPCTAIELAKVPSTPDTPDISVKPQLSSPTDLERMGFDDTEKFGNGGGVREKSDMTGFLLVFVRPRRLVSL
jgi:hypothetical protein